MHHYNAACNKRTFVVRHDQLEAREPSVCLCARAPPECACVQAHNAVTPVCMATRVPIVLDEKIATAEQVWTE